MTCLGQAAAVSTLALNACRVREPVLVETSPVTSRPVATELPTSTVLPNATTTPRPAPTMSFLQTAGAKIVGADGVPVTLTGINWFGMETETLAPHGLWVRSYQDMLDQLVQAGVNCLRLPFSNDLFDPGLQPNGIDFGKNPDLKGLSGLQILDTIVVAAGQRGFKIFLDRHRPTHVAQSQLWYTDHVSQDDWIAQWQALAGRYLGNDAVVGADLHNEPAGPCTWGSGDPKTDWALAAEACGNAILEKNPSWLIFVEGIEKMVDASGNPTDWTWQGGELIGAGDRPIRLNVPNRLVYSPHDYGPSVSNPKWLSDPAFPKNLPDFWDRHWGYLQKSGRSPVLVGEFGGPSEGTDTEGTWQRALVDYLKLNEIHYTYWCLNPNSSDTGGLLEDDWLTIDPKKQALLKEYQGAMVTNHAPDVVNEAAVPPILPNYVGKTPRTVTTVPSPTASPTPLTTPAPSVTPPSTAVAAATAEPTESVTPAPSTTPAPVATPTSRPRTYVVQPGDTLVGIARKLYGDPAQWKQIAAANNSTIQNPSDIHSGQVLTIP
jgi:endoglucanase